ncbi:hypothetical protein [Ochrobactrum sp. BTU1]|uniref:hypothetical protein n=1 Tax=Ochrobactrum sp. BTU1 TaxID=2840456 RepID=UPI001C03EA15|nr:hypothetical protein KMS41_11735 [Ochrobactrum sp. BTU1]
MLNNPGAKDVVLHQGTSSLFELLQNIIAGDDDYALFVHDDVFLPSGINAHIEELKKELDADWPNWGICGNAGIVAPTLAGNSRACRYLFDPHGGPSLCGYMLPAETIDGNMILLNCRALRQASVSLPNFKGFQFYDISLSIETLAAGLAVLIAPNLACYHDSKGNQSEFDSAFSAKGLRDYLANRLSNELVYTLNGTLKLPSARTQGQFDICGKAIENASTGRPKATIAFVIIFGSQDDASLSRAVTDTLKFSEVSQNQSIRTYVVAGNSDKNIDRLSHSNITVINIDLPHCDDRKSFLIRDAINVIEEEFVLFIEDGDYIVSENAEYISNLLTCLPKNSSLVVENRFFFKDSTEDLKNTVSKKGRHSHDWPLIFNGIDELPLCSVFYSTKTLKRNPIDIYDKITFFENYTTAIFSLLNPTSIFFSTPKLLSTSHRRGSNDAGGTMTLSRQSRSYQSRAELARLLCLNKSSSIAFSIGEAFVAASNDSNSQHFVGNPILQLSWLDRKSLASSRFLHGLFAFILSPNHYRYNLQKLASAVRSGGIRTAVRTVADMREQRHYTLK